MPRRIWLFFTLFECSPPHLAESSSRVRVKELPGKS